MYYALPIDDDGVNLEIDPSQKLKNFGSDKLYTSEKNEIRSESQHESSEENYSFDLLEGKHNLVKIFDIGRPRPDANTEKLPYADSDNTAKKRIIKNTASFPSPYRYYEDESLRPNFENAEMFQPGYNMPVFKKPFTISPIYRSIKLKTQSHDGVSKLRPIQDTKKYRLNLAPVVPPIESDEDIRKTIYKDNRKKTRIRPSPFVNMAEKKKSIYEESGPLGSTNRPSHQSSSWPSESEQITFIINMLRMYVMHFLPFRQIL